MCASACVWVAAIMHSSSTQCVEGQGRWHQDLGARPSSSYLPCMRLRHASTTSCLLRDMTRVLYSSLQALLHLLLAAPRLSPSAIQTLLLCAGLHRGDQQPLPPGYPGCNGLTTRGICPQGNWPFCDRWLAGLLCLYCCRWLLLTVALRSIRTLPRVICTLLGSSWAASGSTRWRNQLLGLQLTQAANVSITLCLVSRT